MNFSFFIFLCFIALQVFLHLRKGTSKKVKKPQHETKLQHREHGEHANGTGPSWGAPSKTPPDWKELKSRLQNIPGAGGVSTRYQDKSNETISTRHKETQTHSRHGLRSEPRSMNDFNRARRSDWGERAGPEIVSTRNILIGFAVAVVVLSFLRP